MCSAFPGEEKISRWAATKGKWSFKETGIDYLEPIGQTKNAYGIALSNGEMKDGIVTATISFPVEQLIDSTAGIILGYQSENAGYIIAQLGAYNYAYAISEYEPSSGWHSVAVSGAIANLQPNHPYSVEVSQRGQKIALMVDEVRIFEHILNKPTPGNQIGLFTWGSNPVHFENIIVKREKPHAFVAMPFGEPFDTLYKEVIKPEAESQGFTVVRADEIAGPGIIFEDIKREINEAKVIIVEISSPNQNVFYELGYAHALNKPTVLLAKRGKELPFDIRSYRVIFYEDSIGGKPIVRKISGNICIRYSENFSVL